MKVHEWVLTFLAVSGAIVSTVFYLHSTFAAKATEGEVTTVRQIVCYMAIDLNAPKAKDACRFIIRKGKE